MICFMGFWIFHKGAVATQPSLRPWVLLYLSTNGRWSSQRIQYPSCWIFKFVRRGMMHRRCLKVFHEHAWRGGSFNTTFKKNKKQSCTRVVWHINSIIFILGYILLIITKIHIHRYILKIRETPNDPFIKIIKLNSFICGEFWKTVPSSKLGLKASFTRVRFPYKIFHIACIGHSQRTLAEARRLQILLKLTCPSLQRFLTAFPSNWILFESNELEIKMKKENFSKTSLPYHFLGRRHLSRCIRRWTHGIYEVFTTQTPLSLPPTFA